MARRKVIGWVMEIMIFWGYLAQLHFLLVAAALCLVRCLCCGRPSWQGTVPCRRCPAAALHVKGISESLELFRQIIGLVTMAYHFSLEACGPGLCVLSGLA
jgi:hypothetical protein